MSEAVEPIEAHRFYDACEKLMVTFYQEWHIDPEFINVDNYLERFRPVAEECEVLLVRMTKEPFGVRYLVDDKYFQLGITPERGYFFERIG